MKRIAFALLFYSFYFSSSTPLAYSDNCLGILDSFNGICAPLSEDVCPEHELCVGWNDTISEDVAFPSHYSRPIASKFEQFLTNCSSALGYPGVSCTNAKFDETVFFITFTGAARDVKRAVIQVDNRGLSIDNFPKFHAISPTPEDSVNTTWPSWNTTGLNNSTKHNITTFNSSEDLLPRIRRDVAFVGPFGRVIEGREAEFLKECSQQFHVGCVNVQNTGLTILVTLTGRIDAVQRASVEMEAEGLQLPSFPSIYTSNFAGMSAGSEPHKPTRYFPHHLRTKDCLGLEDVDNLVCSSLQTEYVCHSTDLCAWWDIEITKTVNFLGKYKSVIGHRKILFLKECSVVLKIRCCDVANTGFITVLMQGSTKTMKTTVTTLQNNGLKLPRFRKLPYVYPPKRTLRPTIAPVASLLSQPPTPFRRSVINITSDALTPTPSLRPTSNATESRRPTYSPTSSCPKDKTCCFGMEEKFTFVCSFLQSSFVCQSTEVCVWWNSLVTQTVDLFGVYRNTIGSRKLLFLQECSSRLNVDCLDVADTGFVTVAMQAEPETMKRAISLLQKEGLQLPHFHKLPYVFPGQQPTPKPTQSPVLSTVAYAEIRGLKCPNQWGYSRYLGKTLSAKGCAFLTSKKDFCTELFNYNEGRCSCLMSTTRCKVDFAEDWYSKAIRDTFIFSLAIDDDIQAGYVPLLHRALITNGRPMRAVSEGECSLIVRTNGNFFFLGTGGKARFR